MDGVGLAFDHQVLDRDDVAGSAEGDLVQADRRRVGDVGIGETGHGEGGAGVARRPGGIDGAHGEGVRSGGQGGVVEGHGETGVGRTGIAGVGVADVGPPPTQRNVAPQRAIQIQLDPLQPLRRHRPAADVGDP